MSQNNEYITIGLRASCDELKAILSDACLGTHATAGTLYSRYNQIVLITQELLAGIPPRNRDACGLATRYNKLRTRTHTALKGVTYAA